MNFEISEKSLEISEQSLEISKESLKLVKNPLKLVNNPLKCLFTNYTFYIWDQGVRTLTFVLKGTVSVILSKHSCRDGYARFTTAL